MADFMGRKRGKSHIQNTGIFLVAQDIVLSYRAKFQLILIFFFSGKSYFYLKTNNSIVVVLLA